MLERGEELHPDVRDWLIGFLRGEVSRPKETAGSKGQPFHRFLIWLCVFRLKLAGMQPTRNDASAATSACDAVAEALDLLNLTPTTFG